MDIQHCQHIWIFSTANTDIFSIANMDKYSGLPTEINTTDGRRHRFIRPSKHGESPETTKTTWKTTHRRPSFKRSHVVIGLMSSIIGVKIPERLTENCHSLT